METLESHQHKKLTMPGCQWAALGIYLKFNPMLVDGVRRTLRNNDNSGTRIVERELELRTRAVLQPTLCQYMQPHHYAQPHPPPALSPAQGSPYFNPPPAPRTPHCQLFVLVTLNRFKSWKRVTTFLVARIGSMSAVRI